ARSVAPAAVAFGLTALAYGLAARLGWPNLLLSTAVNLIGAWIVIRLLTRFIRNDFWSRVAAFLAFGVATLNILDLLGPTIVWLDQLNLRLGATRVSALDLLRVIVELALLLWLAAFAARLLESYHVLDCSPHYSVNGDLPAHSLASPSGLGAVAPSLGISDLPR
ncbi:hypothetical protein CNY89_19915, partial [Amaricoccus sp. HAR-UPW-R2A-40]